MVDEIILPAPTAIAEAMVDIVQESFFWEATWVTTQEAVIGFAAGCLIAWILGTLIGLFRMFSLAVYPPVVAFQIMPRVALAPVFLTWFGFGITNDNRSRPGALDRHSTGADVSRPSAASATMA